MMGRTLIPENLRRIRVFTQILKFNKIDNAWSRDPNENSTTQDIEEQVNDWVEQTSNFLLAADTRTELQNPTADVRLIILTCTVIYSEAVTSNVDPAARAGEPGPEFIPAVRRKPATYPGGVDSMGCAEFDVKSGDAGVSAGSSDIQ